MRPIGWPLWPRIVRLGGGWSELDDGLAIEPARLHGGPWRDLRRPPHGHCGRSRRAWRCPGVRWTTSPPPPRPCPDFPDNVGAACWLRAARSRVSGIDYADYDESDAPVRPAETREPGRGPSSGPPTSDAANRDRHRRRPRPLHGAAAPTSPDRDVVAVRARELGRGSLVDRRRVELVGDTTRARPDSLARSCGHRRAGHVLRRTADDTEPVERVIVRQRRPARDRGRHGRPEPAARLHRPVPHRGLRRRARPAAHRHQDRPGRTRADCWPTYAALDVPSRHRQPRRGPGRGAGAAARPHDRAGRASRASASPRWSTPWCRSAERATGHVNAVTGRGRHTSHVGGALPLQGGRLDHRHPRGALVRPGPCRPGTA